MATYLLHGTLLVTIHKAENIVNQDRKSGKAPRFFRKLVETTEEKLKKGKGMSQYYATVDFGETRVGRTCILQGEPKDPVWEETFRIYCAHTVSQVIVSIKDNAIVGTSVIGRARVPVVDLLSGRKIDDYYNIINDHTQEITPARIRISLQFSEATRDPLWGRGVFDSRNDGIPYCYFPQRKGCKVTLYQDAHMEDNFLPPIYLAGGQVYQPQRCWEDIFEAIYNAQRLIYITGWSVYTEIKLCRDHANSRLQVPAGWEGLTLGELLKHKANQGVRVNVMVWNERTSINHLHVHTKGVMKTHDEETARYFEGSNVNCYRCPRNPDSSKTPIQSAEIGIYFSHHQKSVIVDAAAGSEVASDQGSRRIVSFVGGLDLCDGRYDTQSHSLFRTLDTTHSTDFKSSFHDDRSVELGGPRQPWHDIHSRLEGPAAWDVLYNFEQRWRKQAAKRFDSEGDALLPVQELGFLYEEVTSRDDPETWNVQVFRSIDAGAAAGFPKSPEQAAIQGLISGKDNTIDRSIQHAYITAIRRARNFIYIENQYFMGSSFGWESKQGAGASNLIPMELVRKIVSKIEAGERFTVYIVIPLYPEGNPESKPTKAMLDWQRRTFQMMYREIGIALSVKSISCDPREYLTIFCLGNRETRLPGEYVPPLTSDDSHHRSAQENRRFMIYVHSKMMIVDDEYIIVGSANINERSLNGALDSEIAMGSYQPYHLATHSPARGQIYGFRMALWFEHLGFFDNSFLEPWSTDCVRLVNHQADELWDMFTQQEVVDLPGHLLAYPYLVGRDGSLSEKPNHAFIPDTYAKVFGSTSFILPRKLTL